MWTRVLFFLFLGFFAVVFQMGLVAVFPSPFSLINLTLSILVLLIFLNRNFGFLFFSIIWVGFLSELFNPVFFGIHLLTLLSTFSLIIIISNLFLTNKTTVVLITVSFLTFILYNLIFVFFNFLISLKYNVSFSYFFSDYLKIGIIEAFINIPIILLFNFLINRSSLFLKKVFILN